MSKKFRAFLKMVSLFLGDSDAKVLTLAEHIIAAMPDRIKVRFWTIQCSPLYNENQIFRTNPKSSWY